MLEIFLASTSNILDRIYEQNSLQVVTTSVDASHIPVLKTVLKKRFIDLVEQSNASQRYD